MEGFDLHAAIVVPARARDRLERLCRYALRAPLGQDRLHAMADGTIALELRHRWADGTTHLFFDPVELLERAELMQRSFGFDVLACPRCAGRMSLVALIHVPAVVERILRHLGLPAEVLRLRPSRDPPLGPLLEASAG